MSNIFERKTIILILKGDHFHTTSSDCCFRRPYNYSINNRFLIDPPFTVRTKQRFWKKYLVKNNIKKLKKWAYAYLG